MSIVSENSKSAPWWQFVIIVIGFPLLYILKNHFNIIDTLGNLLPAGFVNMTDRNFFVPCWFIILILHWLSAAAVFFFVRRNQQSFASIGINLSFQRYLFMFIILAFIGVLFCLFRDIALDGRRFAPPWLHLGFVMTTNSFERYFYIVVALSAGFCEEIVYRGYAVSFLKTKRFPLVVSLILPAVSFSVMHGWGGIEYNLIMFGAGILFGLLFHLRKTLTLCIIIHSMIDLFVILLD